MLRAGLRGGHFDSGFNYRVGTSEVTVRECRASTSAYFSGFKAERVRRLSQARIDASIGMLHKVSCK